MVAEQPSRTAEEIQKINTFIVEIVESIMVGFDRQKEEVLANSGYMSQLDGEFKEIVSAVQSNKAIVDELEKSIMQFKI